MRTPLLCILLLLIFCPGRLFSQISIKEYKQSENQTFYINTDTSSQKFNAKALKKPIKTSPNLSYTWYKSNQLFTLQGGYDGRVLDGEYSSYFKSNSLRSKGFYKNGIKVKTWYEWSQDGNLKQVSNWKKGMKNGLTFTYDNGRIIKAEQYKNNLLHGKSIEYGTKTTNTFYKKGVIDVEKMKSLAQSPPTAPIKTTVQSPSKNSNSQQNSTSQKVNSSETPKNKKKNIKDKKAGQTKKP